MGETKRDHWTTWAAEKEQSARELEERVRTATGPWIAGLRKWDLFGTLTFDSAKMMRGPLGAQRGSGRTPRDPLTAAEVPDGRADVAMVTSWKAQRAARRFIRDGSIALGRPLPAVIALEPHKSGSMHGHALLDVGGLSMGDIKRLHPLWFDRHGYVRLEEPHSQEDVSGYCGKYMAKDLGELIFSRELLQSGWKLAKGVLR
jgi:hypothetical protein